MTCLLFIDASLSSYFSNSFSAGLLAFFALIILLSISLLCWLRYRSSGTVYLNCWFCNETLCIPQSQAHAWTCPTCEQYNGFDETGNYNSDTVLAAQQGLSSTLAKNNGNATTPEYHIRYHDSQLASTSSGSDAILCHRCQRKQEFFIHRLSLLPVNHLQMESISDVEDSSSDDDYNFVSESESEFDTNSNHEISENDHAGLHSRFDGSQRVQQQKRSTAKKSTHKHRPMNVLSNAHMSQAEERIWLNQRKAELEHEYALCTVCAAKVRTEIQQIDRNVKQRHVIIYNNDILFCDAYACLCGLFYHI